MTPKSATDLVDFKRCQMLCRASLASARKENQPARRDSWSWERGKETKEKIGRTTMLMSVRQMKRKMKIERTTMLMSVREMKIPRRKA